MSGQVALALGSAIIGGILSGGGAFLAVRAQIREEKRQRRGSAAFDSAAAGVAPATALQGLTH